MKHAKMVRVFPYILCSLLLNVAYAENSVRIDNDLYFQHNNISGNTSSSILTNGLTYYDVLSLYTNGNLADYTYSLNVGVRLTDDQRKDLKNVSLYMLSGQIKNDEQVLDLGDYFRSYSKYSMNSGLKGVAYTYSSTTGDTIDVLYGIAYPRWDSFWNNEVESTKRKVYGARYSKKVNEELTAGIDVVKTDDSNEVVANIPLYKTTLLTVNSTYRPIPGLKLYGEYSFSENETSGTGVIKQSGGALFLQAVGNKNPSRVQLEYERVSPDFKTLTGSGTPDREKVKGTWRYKMTDKITFNTGMLWFRDNLDGDQVNTTNTYRPNIGFTFKELFDRRYAVVDLNYKLNNIDSGATKTSDDMYDMNYRDRFGIVYSDISLGYNVYDISNNVRYQNEFRFNTAFNTRHTYENFVLKPSVIVGILDMNDELTNNGNNQYEQAALGLGLDIPKQNISSNFRIGKNRSTRDIGDNMDYVFSSLDLYWNVGKVDQFSNIMIYCKTFLNDYQYTTLANNYREESITLGAKFSF
ncbi:MAG: hypothetical protein V2A75_03400 [Pseudomonadota bacterium]